MRNLVIAGAAFLLVSASMPAFAQDDDEWLPSPFSFQGRVGALFTGDEPFETGAAFEIGMMVRVAPAFHLNFAGGTANFKGSTEPTPLSEAFADFWEAVKRDYVILNPEQADYRINFGTVGGAFKFSRGKIDPYAVGGIGIYQVRFVHTFNFRPVGVPPGFEDPQDITTFQDQRYVFGWYAGGGVNVAINQIIGFATQVTYHSLDTEAIENQVMATFGLHVTIP